MEGTLTRVMKLYVCWGTFPTPRPGGHPCANAYHALRDAGHDPEVIKSYGFAPVAGSAQQRTRGRREVQELTGNRWVPDAGARRRHRRSPTRTRSSSGPPPTPPSAAQRAVVRCAAERHANSTAATEVARLRLDTPARIGMLTQASARASSSSLSP